ncbi:RNase adapter RapZ [Limisalsivibrio acetivorans]|uniref:RNase adapter RapZ n=1 Tax=Limisalsivibrio acetivorans TaxID=1304888 RepID=UPI0003B76035|nr:RNase adapter RapZ [Limisalsivibrio acetivorans]
MYNISLVVLTGLSGAGKSIAANVLEDLGYYTIDNLPLVLLEKFVEVVFDLNMEVSKVALIIDSRSRDSARAYEIIRMLKKSYNAKVIFMYADDEILIRRYKETRRTHPLGENLVDAIREERENLKEIRDISDLTIDTSQTNVHEFAKYLEEYFRDAEGPSLNITVQSFGFKYGVPLDSDLLFDVRFLKNPHFVDELRDFTGKDKRVADYVLLDSKTKKFLQKLKGMLNFLIPNYIDEGKRFLTISIGCTGGRHRSVAIVEFISKYLNKKTNFKVITKHRDMDR